MTFSHRVKFDGNTSKVAKCTCDEWWSNTVRALEEMRALVSDGNGGSLDLLKDSHHVNPKLTPCTLHPTPYTLHPSPYTLHPTPSPYTLNTKPLTLNLKP